MDINNINFKCISYTTRAKEGSSRFIDHALIFLQCYALLFHLLMNERTNEQQQKYCFVRCFSYFICYNLVVLCAFLTTYCYDCIVVVLFFHSCCSAFISCLFLFLVAYIYICNCIGLLGCCSQQWMAQILDCMLALRWRWCRMLIFFRSSHS